MPGTIFAITSVLNTQFAVLSEIYMLYKLLHNSDLVELAKFRQNMSYVPSTVRLLRLLPRVGLILIVSPCHEKFEKFRIVSR